MKNKYTFFLSVILLISSCNKLEQRSSDKAYLNEKALSLIHIRFANRPDIDSKFHFNDKLWIGKMNLAEIFNGEDHEKLDVNTERLPSPITVYPKKKYIVLRHYINYLDYNDYLLQHGDSVIVKYENKRPSVTISNRKQLPFDYGIEDLSRKHFSNNDYSPLSSYFGVRDYSAKRILNSREQMSKSRNTNSILEERIFVL